MKPGLVHELRCPPCGGSLLLMGAQQHDGEIESGLLRCSACAANYPIVASIPRFVPASPNYVSTFGFQWNVFRRTQLDSYSGTTISRDRFFRQTGWSPESLRGHTILDVGCGAGRFVEIALACGAEVFAVDNSAAAVACRENFGTHPQLHVIQADVYALPFAASQFDDVYCFGVLQHTPDAKSAFMALARQLRPGGRLAVDVYAALALNALWPKYWLRPLTRRLPPDHSFQLVRLMVRVLLPVSFAVGRIPWLGRKARYLVPVTNYEGIHPLSREQLYEWSLLDSFDMLAPTYDRPQTAETLRGWMREAGLEEIHVFRAGVICGRGRKAEMIGSLV